MYTKDEQKGNRMKWVEALRSGRYEQGKAMLKTKEGKYCCLGVACDLFMKDKGGEWGVDKYDLPHFQKQYGDLPTSVMEWLGLSDIEGCYRDDIGDRRDLTSDNDGGDYDFEDIASTIEVEPEGLCT